ncbi:MAG: hypothetical protein IKL59_06955 [Clostridia bacterium]|nr:hypothetical protein [Clostridia bacterium]
MKKILAIALTLALALCLAVPAFADEATLSSNTTLTKNITVSGTYDENPTGEVISVDVSWGTMSFTYTPANDGTWNPATHAYTNVPDPVWTPTGNTITVTNHSNTAVDAELSFAKAVDTITGTFTETSGTANNGKLELATAEDTEVNEAPTATATFTVSGSIAESDDLGTITVTIVNK